MAWKKMSRGSIGLRWITSASRSQYSIPRGGRPLHAFVPASKISVFGGSFRFRVGIHLQLRQCLLRALGIGVGETHAEKDVEGASDAPRRRRPS
jgi:hypothetical protein